MNDHHHHHHHHNDDTEDERMRKDSPEAAAFGLKQKLLRSLLCCSCRSGCCFGVACYENLDLFVSVAKLRASGNSALFYKVLNFVITGTSILEKELLYEPYNFQYELTFSIVFDSEYTSLNTPARSPLLTAPPCAAAAASDEQTREEVSSSAAAGAALNRSAAETPACLARRVAFAAVQLQVKNESIAEARDYMLVDYLCNHALVKGFCTWTRNYGGPENEQDQQVDSSKSSRRAVDMLIRCNVTECIGNMQKAADVAQVFASAGQYILCNQLFATLRKFFYLSNQNLKAESVSIDKHRNVWIFPSDDSLSIILTDELLSDEQCELLLLLTEASNIQNVKTQKSTSCSTSTNSSIGPKFSHLPPTELIEYTKWKNIVLQPSKGYFSLNVLKNQEFEDLNILSIAKTVTGLREFLKKAIRYQKACRLFQTHQTACALSSLSYFTNSLKFTKQPKSFTDAHETKCSATKPK